MKTKTRSRSKVDQESGKVFCSLERPYRCPVGPFPNSFYVSGEGVSLISEEKNREYVLVSYQIFLYRLKSVSKKSSYGIRSIFQRSFKYSNLLVRLRDSGSPYRRIQEVHIAR